MFLLPRRVAVAAVLVLSAVSAPATAHAGLLPLPPIPALPAPTTDPLLNVPTGGEVTCQPGGWVGATSFSYAWSFDGAAYATGQTITAPAEAGVLTCAVTGINATGSTPNPIQASVSVTASVAPPVVAPPTIDGTPRSGETATCVPGAVVGATPPYTFRWQRDMAEVAGATNSTYVLGDADVGHSITCTVAATNSAGTTTSLPTLVPLIPSAAGVPIPLNAVKPSITGTAREGSTVTCAPGTWVPADPAFTYQWNIAGTAISAATAATYVIAADDVSKKLTCTVTAKNDFGQTTATSAAVTPVAADSPGGGDGGTGDGGSGDGGSGGTAAEKPSNLTAPTLRGTTRVGQSLTCGQGSWTGNPTNYIYRWVRGAGLIGGADKSTYKLTDADVAQQVKCAVLAGNAGGYGVAVSRTVEPRAKADSKRPTVRAFKFKPKRLVINKRGKFTWKLSEGGRTTIVLERCTKVRGTKCKRWKRVGSLKKMSKRGSNKATFRGKVGKRPVKAGRYRATLTAKDAAGNKSKRKRAKLTLLGA